MQKLGVISLFSAFHAVASGPKLLLETPQISGGPPQGVPTERAPRLTGPRRPGLRGFAQAKGVSVANNASISANIAGRYAQAVFDLIREQGAVDALAGQVESLGAALKDSEDLRKLIASPLFSREQQENAIGAIAGATAAIARIEIRLTFGTAPPTSNMTSRSQ